MNPPKQYVLTFPDGLIVPAFEWNHLGLYLRRFPDSGIREHEYNTLRYTREAITAAAIELSPAPAIAGQPQFVAVTINVMHGARHVATATSHNMAKRIARALNLHPINERGY